MNSILKKKLGSKAILEWILEFSEYLRYAGMSKATVMIHFLRSYSNIMYSRRKSLFRYM